MSTQEGYPKKILVLVKARIDYLKERVYFISQMSRAFNLRLYIFHAVKSITRYFYGDVHFEYRGIESRLTEDIKRFIHLLWEYGVELEERLIAGFPSKNIIIEAFSKRHDLIIMGATERSLLRSVFKESPVEDLMRQTPCDLIIFRPAHED